MGYPTTQNGAGSNFSEIVTTLIQRHNNNSLQANLLKYSIAFVESKLFARKIIAKIIYWFSFWLVTMILFIVN